MASGHRVIGGVMSGVLGTLAGVAAGCSLLALAGRAWARLDVFSHFAPLYGVAGVAVALLAIIAPLRRRRGIVLLALIAAAASGVLVAPEFARTTGPKAAPDARGQIKVIQFNARSRNADIERVADWLIAQHADVVTITEARHDLRDLLLKRAGWRAAGGHGHLIIFTRERYVRMNRPDLGREWDVTFVNATYDNASGPLEAVTTHLTWPTVAIVQAQMQQLEDITGRLPRRRMVLTGDFNATPWSAELRRLDQSLGLTRRDRAVFTWPAQAFGRPWPLPFLPIDHVYAGRGWATVKVERGPWLGSDHYPLIVTLAPVAQP